MNFDWAGPGKTAMVISALHAGWGVTLILSSDAQNITAFSAWVAIGLPHWALGLLLVAASILALYVVLSPVAVRHPYMLALLVPQVVFVVAATQGGIEAVWQGEYGDGEPRPRSFIGADQVVVGPVLIVLYMWSLIALLRERITARLLLERAVRDGH